MTRRFYIGSDDDGHYFVIPVDRKVEWANYLEEMQNENWEFPLPEGVKSIGGAPSLVSFENPSIE